MSTYLIIGNLFSLLSATCIAVSVIKKSKNDLIWWQIIDVIFCILSNIALYTYQNDFQSNQYPPSGTLL